MKEKEPIRSQLLCKKVFIPLNNLDYIHHCANLFLCPNLQHTCVTLHIYFYSICLRIIPGNRSKLYGKSKVISRLYEHVFYFTKLVMGIIKYLLSPPRKQEFAQSLLGFTLYNKNNHCACNSCATHLPLVMAKHLEMGNSEMLHFHTLSHTILKSYTLFVLLVVAVSSLPDVSLVGLPTIFCQVDTRYNWCEAHTLSKKS